MVQFAFIFIGFIILAWGLGAPESERRDGTAGVLIGFGGVLMILGGWALLCGI